MEMFLVTLAAIMPSIGWVMLCFWWDRQEPEPKILIIKLFFAGTLMGLLIAAIVVILQAALVSSGVFVSFSALSEKDSLISFITAGAIIALVHALVTLWIAKILVTREKSFTQIVDGIIYFSVIALGSALTENIISGIMYFFSNGAAVQTLNELIYGLVFNAIFLGVSAGIIGFAFGNVYKRAAQDGVIEDNELGTSWKNPEIAEGLAIAILLHTSYQVFVYLKEPRAAGIVAIIGMFYIFTRFASRAFTANFQQ